MLLFAAQPLTDDNSNSPIEIGAAPTLTWMAASFPDYLADAYRYPPDRLLVSALPPNHRYCLKTLGFIRQQQGQSPH